MAKSMIQKIQEVLGTTPDGIWGPKTQTALNKEIQKTASEINSKLQEVKTTLGIRAHGLWDIKSQAALNKVISKGNGFSMTASSFADLADVAAFKKCKATGKTDVQCFKVGDNGIGQFGQVTAQNRIPMVALHADDMKAKWGSVNAAAHRAVSVTVKSKTVQATVEDRISVKNRIDLNPAAAEALGLTPPFLVPCVWNWVV